MKLTLRWLGRIGDERCEAGHVRVPPSRCLAEVFTGAGSQHALHAAAANARKRAVLRRCHDARVQSVAGSSPRSSSSEKDAEEGGMLGRLTPVQRHQLAVLLDTAMLKVRAAAMAPPRLHLEAVMLPTVYLLKLSRFNYHPQGMFELYALQAAWPATRLRLCAMWLRAAGMTKLVLLSDAAAAPEDAVCRRSSHIQRMTTSMLCRRRCWRCTTRGSCCASCSGAMWWT